MNYETIQRIAATPTRTRATQQSAITIGFIWFTPSSISLTCINRLSGAKKRDGYLAAAASSPGLGGILFVGDAAARGIRLLLLAKSHFFGETLKASNDLPRRPNLSDLSACHFTDRGLSTSNGCRNLRLRHARALQSNEKVLNVHTL
jgi:hypothetical protein